MRRAAKAAAEEAESPARVRSPTLSRRLSLQTPFEPGDKFFAAARALWADAAVRGCFDKINPCTFDKVFLDIGIGPSACRNAMKTLKNNLEQT